MLKVCVLQPDYSTSSVDYQYYDPPRDLSMLIPEARVDHVFLNKLTTYRQLKALSKSGYDIFVNLCEGYLEWEIPSIDVIFFLESLNLPFTGPTSKLYDPPKPLMKYVAYCAGVATPPFCLIRSIAEAEQIRDLTYPLFVKPAKAGDSLGVDDQSMVRDKAEMLLQISRLLPEYDELLVEEYIAGREFTVLVAANPLPDKTCRSFNPVEYRFPENRSYKTYALKTSELHPDCNFPCDDPELAHTLRAASERIFREFGGSGYARLDFRVNARKEVFFLEINFTCSVFYTDGYEGSADFVLRFDGIGQSGFLRHIIAEGMARHQDRQKKYMVLGNSISGYGIYATRDLEPGEVIFRGEERAWRMVTRRHVETHWSDREKDFFRRYAWPVSKEVYVLWDDDPQNWAPQNHSCMANTGYDGLNVVALQRIAKNEELTLDYAAFLDESAEPFVCNCGAPGCRGLIAGQPGNSVTRREENLLKKEEAPSQKG